MSRTPPRRTIRILTLQTDDDSGCHSEEDELARCQSSGGTILFDQLVRDVHSQPHRAEQDRHCPQGPDQTICAVDGGTCSWISEEERSQRDHVPQPEPDPARGPESQRQAVLGRPSQGSLVYPVLGRLAVELPGLYAAAEKLEAADDDGRAREDASDREANVEGEEPPYSAEDRARGETGQRRRERVDGRLTDPAPARLVPKHVGTRDSVDRVGASREGLLGDGRYHRRADEQPEDPTYPAGAMRECPDDDAEPGGG